MTVAPFPVTPELTAIAIAYRNIRFIADSVLVRVPVPQKSFKYRKFSVADGYTIPDTKVGRTTPPNRVEIGFTEATDTCIDQGLDDGVPYDDIQVARGGYDPVGFAAEWLAYLVALDRERRVANLVFDANQYGTNNKLTLSGTSQWSDFTNSNPVVAIMNALDACMMRPNIMTIGRAAFTQLRMHPKVVNAVYKDTSTSGIVPKQAIADLFELEDIQVGEAMANSTARGQTPTLARLWGKHCSLLYRDAAAARAGGTVFGFTAQFGGKIGGSTPDKTIGMKGGELVRIGESVKEVICANDLGYFFQNAVA